LDLALTLSWLGLAAIHSTPAMVFFKPDLTEKLYSQPAEGPIGLLLVHRGGLFLAIFVACIIAAFHNPSRQLGVIIVSISMLSFLWLYYKAGQPKGGLANIAKVDLLGLPLLALVAYGGFLR
jgi:hypothetical protein